MPKSILELDSVNTPLCPLNLPAATQPPDTLRSVALHGTVCFTGMLSNEWTVKDFYATGYLPRGVRLTAYSGEAADLPSSVLQQFLDDVIAGRITVPIARTYTLNQIVDAHRDLEAGRHSGKLVVVVTEERRCCPQP